MEQMDSMPVLKVQTNNRLALVRQNLISNGHRSQSPKLEKTKLEIRRQARTIKGKKLRLAGGRPSIIPFIPPARRDPSPR